MRVNHLIKVKRTSDLWYLVSGEVHGLGGGVIEEMKYTRGR